jgi:mannose-6-phosphate isomerase-like protein (cupin superfamily)
MKAAIKKNRPNSEYYFAEGCYIIEMSNSSDDPEMSIARARVKPGKTTRWHELQNTAERYIILQGQGKVEIGDEAQKTVTAGDVVIIPASMRQRISNVGDTDLIFLAICTPAFNKSCYLDLQSDS